MTCGEEWAVKGQVVVEEARAEVAAGKENAWEKESTSGTTQKE